jgi:D-alanine-D-alanine ligase
MAAEIFPAPIDEALAQRLQDIALRVHALLRLRDVSRIDFLVDADGRAWCLEANALPGMTANSLLPRAARAAGLTFAEVCDELVQRAARRS